MLKFLNVLRCKFKPNLKEDQVCEVWRLPLAPSICNNSCQMIKYFVSSNTPSRHESVQIETNLREDNLAQVPEALKVFLSFGRVIARLGIRGQETERYLYKREASKNVVDASKIGKGQIQRPRKRTKLVK